MWCSIPELEAVPYSFFGLWDVPSSNNLAESAMRPFAVGRKSGLFWDSVKGAESSIIVYSLAEMAKANEIEPYEYLLPVLSMLPYLGKSTDHEELEKLMPRQPAVWHREHIRKWMNGRVLRTGLCRDFYGRIVIGCLRLIAVKLRINRGQTLPAVKNQLFWNHYLCWRTFNRTKFAANILASVFQEHFCANRKTRSDAGNQRSDSIAIPTPLEIRSLFVPEWMVFIRSVIYLPLVCILITLDYIFPTWYYKKV